MYGIAYINVDSSMWGKKIKIYYNDQAYGRPNVIMYNANGNELSRSKASSTEIEYTIPQNATLLKFERAESYLMIIEIKIL